MFCSKCGSELKGDEKFCSGCGTPISINETKVDENCILDRTSRDITAASSEEGEVSVDEDDSTVYEDLSSKTVEQIITENFCEAFAKPECFYVGSKIPENFLNNALKKISKNHAVNASDILAIYSLNGSSGFAFTKDAIYEYSARCVAINFAEVTAIKCKTPFLYKILGFITIGMGVYEDNPFVNIIIKKGRKKIRKYGDGEARFDHKKFFIALNAIIEKVQGKNGISTVVVDNCNTFKENNKDISDKVTVKNRSLIKIIIEFFLVLAIFSYSTYVIFNNFSIGDGYVWAVISIFIALFSFIFLGSYLQNIVLRIFGKCKKIFTYLILILLFVFIASVSYKPLKGRLEEASKGLVTQIISENFGNYIDVAECVKVKITREIVDKSIYEGYAILENGNKVDISITYDADDDYVYVEILDL